MIDEGEGIAVVLEIEITDHFASGLIEEGAHDAEERRPGIGVFDADTIEGVAGPERASQFIEGEREAFVVSEDEAVDVLAAIVGIDDDEGVVGAFLDDVEADGIDELGLGAAGLARLGLRQFEVLGGELWIARDLGPGRQSEEHQQ